MRPARRKSLHSPPPTAPTLSPFALPGAMGPGQCGETSSGQCVSGRRTTCTLSKHTEYGLSSGCAWTNHHRKPCGGKAQEEPARRRQKPTTSASVMHKASGPNAAQRRSAKRLQDFLQLKGAHHSGGVHSQDSTSGVVARSQCRPDPACARPRGCAKCGRGHWWRAEASG